MYTEIIWTLNLFMIQTNYLNKGGKKTKQEKKMNVDA